MITEPFSLPAQQPWYVTFHDLMPYRVREILLVSSPYDAYILEEDGRLTESIFSEKHSLSSAPRITHVATGARAMELLAERRFDLVITMMHIPDIDVTAFGRRVKKLHPAMPVVLLVLTEADLSQLPGGVAPRAIDYVFWWTGDARILMAIIKLVEDGINTPHDTRVAGVRCIIVVEDSIRRYSSFLTLLYSELMAQASSLVAEGVNDLLQLMRMRARPKLLLARTYEEAMALYNHYRDSVIALVSDVRFPRQGEEDPQAGFRLVETIRADNPDVVILMQSAEPQNAIRAAQMGLYYVDKNSPSLLKQIRLFVTENLAFGDFVFRMQSGVEVGRARDTFELEQMLRVVPGESIELHASRNHFSMWLMTRCMFDLAKRVRPRNTEEFGGVEGLRKYLLRELEIVRVQQQEGVITDFSSKQAGPNTPFLRVGNGSIGGKARGLAFVSSVLARGSFESRFEGLSIRVPRSVVIPTNEFERFIDTNPNLENATKLGDEQAVLNWFLQGKFTKVFLDDLRRVFANLRGPLAIRSSSLLEDSQLQAFAGIYSTYMLPNNHPDPEVRFNELCQAIKAVYASTYSADARAYIAGTPYSIEEERMAVLIQELVGSTFGNRFYPTVSGVAVSYNYYPLGGQKADEGLAMLALGLGQTVVAGGATLQFSPSTPSILPQFGSAQDYLRYSQRKFWALDLGRSVVDFTQGAEASLAQFDLAAAEEDGALALVGSTYRPDDEAIHDDISQPGPRVVSFHNILKWNALPLPEALEQLLKQFRDGFGCAVEIEFVLEAGDWGKRRNGGQASKPQLYVLQVRPQGFQMADNSVQMDNFPPEEILCQSDRSLGHGVVDGIADVVFVKRSDLGSDETPQVAIQVGMMNEKLQQEKVPYLLVGPGRWGSSDLGLGIPVKWAQIAGARVIVETTFKDREVEPSQGAHFFHNVTAFRVGYLTLSNLDRQATAARRRFDMAWLEKQRTISETADVRHVRLDKPLRIYLDGRHSTALILKPAQ